MRRILIIIPGLELGGAQKAVRLLANELALRGIPFRILCLYGPISEEAETWADLPVVPVRSWAALNESKIKSLIRFCGEVRRYDPHFIYAWLLRGHKLGFLAKLIAPRARLALSFRNYHAGFSPRDLALYRSLGRFVDSWTFNVKPLRKVLVRLISATNPRLHYIPNAVETSNSRVGLEEQLAVRSLSKTVLMPARIVPYKNQLLALDGLNAVVAEWRGRGFKLVLRGPKADHEYFEVCSDYIRAAGLADVAEIKAATAQRTELYDGVGMILLASRHEGFANVILEAWSVGAVVITSEEADLNGLVVDGLNGLTFRLSGGEEELPRALRKASLLSPERRITLAEAGLQSLKEFSTHAMADATLRALGYSD